MKKVSTTAVKQSKNISQQKLTIGLDLGDRSSWYCLLDEVGKCCWNRNWARLEGDARGVRKHAALPDRARRLEITTRRPGWAQYGLWMYT